ncbi:MULTISPECIES: hypothetical protein [Rhodomicrobium]|uniref:hypothetical protein n=1 Tax=Rhodomicrobium TaxID=1068 RepID=UPI000B4ADBFD|nr:MULTISPECIES: hypothetical protein [Rhodomicrobium]
MKHAIGIAVLLSLVPAAAHAEKDRVCVSAAESERASCVSLAKGRTAALNTCQAKYDRRVGTCANILDPATTGRPRR